MKLRLPQVTHIIAVASGKGGVGKTTVTVNLALALQKRGHRVGVFDADVYGPNVPLMLGIHQRREVKGGYATIVRNRDAQPYIKPLTRYELQIMSVGLLIGEQQVINPPASAVGMFVVRTLQDVLWENLDYLLIDLPPSAGQPQEDLLKRIEIAGAVIVTTPQDLSLLDSSRALQMFTNANVPILGVVENMSYFICPNCDEKHEIFQRSKQWELPTLANAPILGRIPLTAEISRGINKANPLMHHQPDTPQAQAFLEIASAVQEQLSSPHTTVS